MTPHPSSADVTALLVEWAGGQGGTLDRLLPLVYAELRRLAGGHLRRERRDHTLQPTALINELYLQLVRQHAATWQNRAHFFALASRLMRRILVDHARARQAGKRGGCATAIVLDEDAAAVSSSSAEADRSLEVLAVDEALSRLTALDAEQGRIVELRFFAGLSVEETAHVLDRSPRTVKREWRLAKAWLHRELGSARS